MDHHDQIIRIRMHYHGLALERFRVTKRRVNCDTCPTKIEPGQAIRIFSNDGYKSGRSWQCIQCATQTIARHYNPFKETGDPFYSLDLYETDSGDETLSQADAARLFINLLEAKDHE